MMYKYKTLGYLSSFSSVDYSSIICKDNEWIILNFKNYHNPYNIEIIIHKFVSNAKPDGIYEIYFRINKPIQLDIRKQYIEETENGSSYGLTPCYVDEIYIDKIVRCTNTN